ncbi:MAG: hypothetical protein ACLSVD_10595 [Eggerthellaceae bacterium]
MTALATSMTDNQAGPYYVLFDSSNAEVVAVIEKGLSTGDVLKGVRSRSWPTRPARPSLRRRSRRTSRRQLRVRTRRSARRPTCWRRTATARSTW